jgi:hypothetical protein
VSFNNKKKGYQMGYTHYFETEGQIMINVPVIKAIVEKFKNIIDHDETSDQNFFISDNKILLNGIDDNAHETFIIDGNVKKDSFCKTNNKPYDIVVCMILLVLKKENGRLFKLTSDGFCKTGIDQEWFESAKVLDEMVFIKNHRLCLKSDESRQLDWKKILEDVYKYR